jgi:hypothetical protein
MKRREKRETMIQTRRELDAIDAALSGEADAAGDAPLVDLARALQAMRPHPRDEFVHALDARAAGGFSRDARASDDPRHGRRASRRQRRVLAPTRRRAQLVAALGVLATVALVAVVAVSQWRSGGATRAPRPEPALAGASPSGSSGSASAPSGVAAPETSAPNVRGANGAILRESPATPAPGAAVHRIERTSTLDLGVASGSIESTAQRVFTLVSAFNGYVRQSNVSSGGGGQAGASFDVRVPTSNLTAAIAALAHLGHVRSENDTTNDVTDQFQSLTHSLGDLTAERASLLRQLAASADAKAAAALKARLHEVEAGIARAQGALRSLRARIDYTRLSLSLTPEAAGGASRGDLTPGGAARNAAQILETALAVLVIGAAAALPVALLAIIGWIAVALMRRRLRERVLDAR